MKGLPVSLFFSRKVLFLKSCLGTRSKFPYVPKRKLTLEMDALGRKVREWEGNTRPVRGHYPKSWKCGITWHGLSSRLSKGRSRWSAFLAAERRGLSLWSWIKTSEVTDPFSECLSLPGRRSLVLED